MVVRADKYIGTLGYPVEIPSQTPQEMHLNTAAPDLHASKVATGKANLAALQPASWLRTKEIACC